MTLVRFAGKLLLLIVVFCGPLWLHAQSETKWTPDGNGYYQMQSDELVRKELPGMTSITVLSKKQLTPAGAGSPLVVSDFQFSANSNAVLLFTNTQKVWRLNTRGDYWVYDKAAQTLRQLGKGRPASSLMFAKFSPDGKQVAYVSECNIYTEDIATGAIQQLTTDGAFRQLINGTFDWAYEEEFFCRDGFRWSPDSRRIAYWQIDARGTKNYLMVNNTDSIYPTAVPVEYPVAGERPSPFRIGVVNASGGATRWMSIPTDPLQGYLPRMEWAGNDELIVQHLNRKQNESTLLLCNAGTGAATRIYQEKDAAWIDVIALWDQDYSRGGWDWLNDGKEFVWASEKDGWRHLYRVSRDGKKETRITNGNYDVIDISCIDEKGGYVYFIASPQNATQRYLYRTRLDGKGEAQRLSPAGQQGTHEYDISPFARYAWHSFSNRNTAPYSSFIAVADHRKLEDKSVIEQKIERNVPEFFTIQTEEGVEMDAWMAKPAKFDSTKKYPVVFYVYTEPWGQTVKDAYGAGRNHMYLGDMAAEGYIYISIDNRGTPVPKGRDWRKIVYRKIGQVNIRDQAMAARALFKKYAFIDTSRVAVWGWSGGGSATLNLLFQYPDIYKTGIAIAAVGNQLTYDNIYQERYMGLPQENQDDFVKGSPITYAKNLQGNLLYIHGTGDDNVHYSNAEMLINELVKYNKPFQMMAYPNRTHSINEGKGTTPHLRALYTSYLKEHCPPGPR